MTEINTKFIQDIKMGHSKKIPNYNNDATGVPLVSSIDKPIISKSS